MIVPGAIAGQHLRGMECLDILPPSSWIGHRAHFRCFSPNAVNEIQLIVLIFIEYVACPDFENHF